MFALFQRPWWKLFSLNWSVARRRTSERSGIIQHGYSG